MSSSLDINVSGVLAAMLLLLVPLTVSKWLKLGLAKESLLSVTRMALQLTLVGLYLEYLFVLDSSFINAVWVVLMTLIGASAITTKSKLKRSEALLVVVCGQVVGVLPVVMLLLVTSIQAAQPLSAQYLIPVAGMLLGNCMSGNIIALQRLFNCFEDRYPEYQACLALGASKTQALHPFVQTALNQAQAPLLATMATTGLVTLPGMMTGQILAGASPWLAIKYQLVIMLGIFAALSLSTLVTLQLGLRRWVSENGRIKVETN